MEKSDLIITLTNFEAWLAAQVGLRRQFDNYQKDRTNAYGAKHSWDLHIDGALAEAAVAKHFNKFWGNVSTPDQDDDVGGIQVRSTHHQSGRLILHDRDKDNSPYILVIHLPYFKYKLAGWLLGKDGKRESFIKDPKGGRPAYFIPQTELKPIEALGLDIARYFKVA